MPRELDATDVCWPWNVGHVEFAEGAPGELAREHARSGWGEARLALFRSVLRGSLLVSHVELAGLAPAIFHNS